jgi:hypothetical protein
VRRVGFPVVLATGCPSVPTMPRTCLGKLVRTVSLAEVRASTIGAAAIAANLRDDGFGLGCSADDSAPGPRHPARLGPAQLPSWAQSSVLL